MRFNIIVAALAVLLGGSTSSHADVQDIRLSGDIRLRGYYLRHTDDLESDNGRYADSFISQRTRARIEATLTERVVIVTTLQAEGLWGQDNDAGKSSGAGSDVANTDFSEEGSGGAATPTGQNSDRGQNAINRRWEAGITEAFVEFNDLFDLPVRLRLGRQFLHYGRGLVISSVEEEYNFDAARLVLDLYPFTIDFVYARAIEGGSFGWDSGQDDAELLFFNAHWDSSLPVLKFLEFYAGYLAYNGPPQRRVPPTDWVYTDAPVGASPYLIGFRGAIEPISNLVLWAEANYQSGNDGAVTDGAEIHAGLLDLGIRYTLEAIPWQPTANIGFTLATGGGGTNRGGSGRYRPWFTYVEGYHGYLFAPLLSNVRILNAGLSLQPTKAMNLNFQAYRYDRANHQVVYSDPNVDFGGVGVPTGKESKEEVGWEFDAVGTFDYSEDVRFQLIYAVFLPDNAFTQVSADAAAMEVRAEVSARF